jgi:uncharacterized membrane protein YvlD (DUF360 family)
MSGVTGQLIKLGVGLVVFTTVFWLAAKNFKGIHFAKKWVAPLVGLVFAVLNTVLYWALTPLLELATLGTIAFAMPLVANALLLLVTERVFARRAPIDPKKQKDAPSPLFHVEGFFTTVWMAIFLSLAHGALWISLDYIPSHA